MGRGEIADLSHWHYDAFLARWRTPLFRQDFTTLVAFALDRNARPLSLKMRLNRDMVAAERADP
jgi:hypothetical protein